jgi:uncharacterized protein
VQTIVVAILLLTSCAAFAQTVPLPVIDMHLHADTADSNGPPPLAMCRSSQGYPARDPARPWPEVFMERLKNPECPDPIWSPATDDELMKRSLEILQRRNVIGVTSGRRLAEWQKAGGDRIVPGLGLHFHASSPSPDQVRKWFQDKRYLVMAEVAVQYEGVAPSDAWLDPYLAVAEELDVPVGIHIGPGPPGALYLPGMGKYRAKLHSALLLEDALIKHPRLRIYIMHAGWPMLDDLMAMLWAHPQLYVDVGVISFAIPRAEFHRYLQRIVDAGFGKRVMFGSDQMNWPEAIEVAIDAIESADFLTAAQKRDILYHNAARFLRLTAEEIARHHGR